MAEDASTHSEIAARLLDGRSAVGQPAVSPDGSMTAFVVSTIDLERNTTTSRVWLHTGDGSPTPITAGDHDNHPMWSPDGRWLAFTSRRGEKEGDSTLHVLPVDGPGESRTVCTRKDGLDDVAWSPDGKWLAFTSRTPDERYDAEGVSWQPPRKIERFFSRENGEDWVFDRPKHVYVVAADGTGAPRNLTPGEFQHSGVSWLPDSTGIVTSAQRHDTWDRDLATDLYLVSLAGDIRPLTHQAGMYHLPAVSPDGQRVACLGEPRLDLDPQNVLVGLVDLATGGEPRWISEGLDRTFLSHTAGVRPPVWETADTLLGSAEDRGETHLYRLFADGATPERLTDGPITVHGYDAAGGTIRLATSTVEHPAELARLDGDITSLTTSYRGWERFTVPSTDGTVEIDAWIMFPAGVDPTVGTSGSAKHPVLLNVHGGPHTQYGESFFDEAQMQAAAGFAVIMSNPRGSSGREESWGQAITGPDHPVKPGTGWGGADAADVLAVLDHALERYPVCDPDRVGMLGGSYGGYMATWLAAHHGDRFKGICSERAVNNLVSEEWSSDIATGFRLYHGASIIENLATYVAQSPAELAADITVPMLLIHSEEDYRCPISQAEQLWMTLKLLDRDVTFYRFPGENHELTRSGSPVHRRQRAEIVLDWFADKLGT